jgi:hypothetical protein
VRKTHCDWQNVDYIRMTQFMMNSNWYDVLAFNLTTDSLWAAFSEILPSVIYKFDAVKTIDDGKRMKTLKKWYLPGIKRAVARK